MIPKFKYFLLLSSLILIGGCHFSLDKEIVDQYDQELENSDTKYEALQVDIIKRIDNYETSMEEPLDSLPERTQSFLKKDSALLEARKGITSEIAKTKLSLTIVQSNIQNAINSAQNWKMGIPSRQLSALETKREWKVKMDKVHLRLVEMEGVLKRVNLVEQLIESWVEMALLFKPPRPVYYYPVYVQPVINP